ncbi:RNA-binding protein [Paenibacillus agricola]|uniref:RNA-binding protein n=1 Tax=Paenibacillus agricola TaxID=2716264 RepID=A0ABX0J472_9BACL|nr:RNA-binding protein [Paenibacillus agricola]NHN30621.1 RNA-binding protein [Paenibacillus agricola]
MMISTNLITEVNEAEALHLPDIQFVNYCFQEYGLNRGIYNTIDQWLFSFGYKEIIGRRQITVNFLKDIHNKHGKDRSNVLRFGKGGLTKQLHDFIHLPKSVFLYS